MKNIIASIVRNLLQVLAGVLLAYGVNESDAHEWIKASEPVITGLLLYVFAQAWSLKNVARFAEIAKRFGFRI